MPSNMPTTLTLPPFQGVVRRVITIALVTFFALLVLSATPFYPTAMGWLALWPAGVLRAPWQVVTYPYVPGAIISTLFALLSIWFFGSALESERGSRWFAEYFFVTTIGGGVLAALLARLQVLGLIPAGYVVGLWPFSLALVLAYARFHPDQPLRFNFILTLKAKYLAAIYLLLYLAFALQGGDRLGATTAICASLCGFLFLRFAPRRGLGFAASESWFSIRNAFYRSKRRRAAKKFTVYMKKQGKDVNIDSSGRYVELDDKPRNPKDRSWMN